MLMLKPHRWLENQKEVYCFWCKCTRNNSLGLPKLHGKGNSQLTWLEWKDGPSEITIHTKMTRQKAAALPHGCVMTDALRSAWTCQPPNGFCHASNAHFTLINISCMQFHNANKVWSRRWKQHCCQWGCCIVTKTKKKKKNHEALCSFAHFCKCCTRIEIPV